MPADLGWGLGAGFKRLCLQTIKNHINLNCQRRNGFQKLLTASTAPPQPVQGRPRGKHKATNPQTVELAGKQILLLLLQACAGVIANQNLPWLQTRSLSANAMVETGQPPRGRCPHDSASPSGRIAANGASGNPGLWTFVWSPFFPPKDLDLKIRKRDKAQMTVGS